MDKVFWIAGIVLTLFIFGPERVRSVIGVTVGGIGCILIALIPFAIAWAWRFKVWM